MTTIFYRGYSIIRIAHGKWEYFDPETRLTHRHTSLESAKAEIREGTKLTPTPMNTPTIPEIAEMLRHHVRTSNEAPRLIVESILPLIGVEVDNLSDLTGGATKAQLEEYTEEIREIARNVRNVIDDMEEEDRVVPHALRGVEEELDELADRIDP